MSRVVDYFIVVGTGPNLRPIDDSSDDSTSSRSAAGVTPNPPAASAESTTLQAHPPTATVTLNTAPKSSLTTGSSNSITPPPASKPILPPGKFRSYMQRLYRGYTLSRFPQVDHASVPFPSGIEMFCIPDSISLTHEHCALPTLHYFAATQGNGSRLYGACLKFHERIPNDSVEVLEENDRATLAAVEAENESYTTAGRARGVTNTSAMFGHHYNAQNEESRVLNDYEGGITFHEGEEDGQSMLTRVHNNNNNKHISDEPLLDDHSHIPSVEQMDSMNNPLSQIGLDDPELMLSVSPSLEFAQGESGNTTNPTSMLKGERERSITRKRRSRSSSPTRVAVGVGTPSQLMNSVHGSPAHQPLNHTHHNPQRRATMGSQPSSASTANLTASQPNQAYPSPPRPHRGTITIDSFRGIGANGVANTNENANATAANPSPLVVGRPLGGAINQQPQTNNQQQQLQPSSAHQLHQPSSSNPQQQHFLQRRPSSALQPHQYHHSHNQQYNNHHHHTHTGSQLQKSKPPQPVYAPKCICILSLHPFLEQYRIFLTELYRISLTPSALPLERYISNFVLEVPLPPLGELKYAYSISNHSVIFARSPPNNPLLVINHLKDAMNGNTMTSRGTSSRILTLFELLDIENILFILECILLEKRILFLSNRLSLLTIISEIFLHLIYPFQWNHVYIPLLPRALIDFLYAPMPFIIGMCHTYVKGHLQGDMLSDLIVCDLDCNKVHYSNNPHAIGVVGGIGGGSNAATSSSSPQQTTSLGGSSPYDMFSSHIHHFLPSKERKKLKLKLQPFQALFSRPNMLNTGGSSASTPNNSHNKPPHLAYQLRVLDELDLAFPNSAHPDELDAIETYANLLADLHEQEHVISLAFFRCFVSMFNHYRDCLIFPTQANPFPDPLFKLKDFFKKSSIDSDSSVGEFYTAFIKTQAFQKFCEERIYAMTMKEAERKKDQQAIASLHHIQFFDESIHAKRNRSMFITKRLATPFLDDKKKYEFKKTIVIPQPEEGGIVFPYIRDEVTSPNTYTATSRNSIVSPMSDVQSPMSSPSPNTPTSASVNGPTSTVVVVNKKSSPSNMFTYETFPDILDPKLFWHERLRVDGGGVGRDGFGIGCGEGDMMGGAGTPHAKHPTHERRSSHLTSGLTNLPSERLDMQVESLWFLLLTSIATHYHSRKLLNFGISHLFSRVSQVVTARQLSIDPKSSSSSTATPLSPTLTDTPLPPSEETFLRLMKACGVCSCPERATDIFQGGMMRLSEYSTTLSDKSSPEATAMYTLLLQIHSSNNDQRGVAEGLTKLRKAAMNGGTLHAGDLTVPPTPHAGAGSAATMGMSPTKLADSTIKANTASPSTLPTYQRTSGATGAVSAASVPHTPLASSTAAAASMVSPLLGASPIVAAPGSPMSTATLSPRTRKRSKKIMRPGALAQMSPSDTTGDGAFSMNELDAFDGEEEDDTSDEEGTDASGTATDSLDESMENGSGQAQTMTPHLSVMIDPATRLYHSYQSNFSHMFPTLICEVVAVCACGTVLSDSDVRAGWAHSQNIFDSTTVCTKCKTRFIPKLKVRTKTGEGSVYTPQQMSGSGGAAIVGTTTVAASTTSPSATTPAATTTSATTEKLTSVTVDYLPPHYLRNSLQDLLSSAATSSTSSHPLHPFISSSTTTPSFPLTHPSLYWSLLWHFTNHKLATRFVSEPEHYAEPLTPALPVRSSHGSKRKHGKSKEAGAAGGGGGGGVGGIGSAMLASGKNGGSSKTPLTQVSSSGRFNTGTPLAPNSVTQIAKTGTPLASSSSSDAVSPAASVAAKLKSAAPSSSTASTGGSSIDTTRSVNTEASTVTNSRDELSTILGDDYTSQLPVSPQTIHFTTLSPTSSNSNASASSTAGGGDGLLRSPAEVAAALHAALLAGQRENGGSAAALISPHSSNASQILSPASIINSPTSTTSARN